AGRITLAVLAGSLIRRRRLIRLFLVPGVLIMPVVFFVAPRYGLRPIEWATFAAGFVTVAQFSFWGNYLPRVYPVHLRGTGESFAMNTGGRLLGTSFAAITATLAVTSNIADAPAKVALVASGVGFAVL